MSNFHVSMQPKTLRELQLVNQFETIDERNSRATLLFSALMFIIGMLIGISL